MCRLDPHRLKIFILIRFLSIYKINLQKYVDELSSIYRIYIYSKYAFENDNLRQEIIEQEYKTREGVPGQ